MKLKLSCFAILLTATFGSTAFGAITYTTDNQVQGTAGSPTFTPSYVVSQSDLLNGKLPESSSGNFQLEDAGGLSILTDGAYGTIQEPNGQHHPAFATAGNGNGSGSFAVYSLIDPTHPDGYDIQNIDVFGGWNDNGRDQQRYNLYYSTVAAPDAFVQLASVDYNPNIGGGLQSATQVHIYDNASSVLASAVAKLKFDFSPAVENGHVGYAEFDVHGAPTVVPEASTLSLLAAVGGIGLVAGWRRRRR